MSWKGKIESLSRKSTQTSCESRQSSLDQASEKLRVRMKA